MNLRSSIRRTLENVVLGLYWGEPSLCLKLKVELAWGWPAFDRDVFCPLRGTLASLVAEYLCGRCMLGIVLDRMEECPEEVEVSDYSEPFLTQAVELLRAKFPIDQVVQLKRSSTT